MKKVALLYLKEHQIPCIPCSGGNEGKVPTFRWKQYQKKRPTESEIQDMFLASLKHTPDGRSPNIAALCGKVSGIGVIEIDKMNEFHELGLQIPKDCPMVWSPNEGVHLFHRPPNNIKEVIKTFSVKDEHGAEIYSVRSEGSILLLPPSRNFKTGKFYEWAKGRAIWDLPLPDLPECFFKPVEKVKYENSNYNKDGSDKIMELTSEQHDNAIVLLSPYWREGKRQHLTEFCSGYLAKNQYSYKSVVGLITDLAEHKNDCELNSDRIPCVKSTYEKYQAEGESSIKGWSGLNTILSQEDLNRFERIVNTTNFERKGSKKVTVTSVNEIGLPPYNSTSI